MGLSAVQDLLELFVSRLLSFHSHLQEETKVVISHPVLRHDLLCLYVEQDKKKSLKVDLEVLFRLTSRMVISFSFSFPALFLTCVFLVSTHTTLSFTSDLDTHISTQTY